MTVESSFELLALHAVRITGFADTSAIARRFGLDPAQTMEFLLDAEARGWAMKAAFADVQGWSLTEAGRAENERQLAAELARTGDAGAVREVYGAFLPWNARLQQACTDWQLRPTANDRFAVNDHTDPAWDARILNELTAIDLALAPLAARLESILARFHGYHERFTAARQRALAGDARWVDRTDVDSCHRVWFELHEDLIATLGLDRGTENGTAK